MKAEAIAVERHGDPVLSARLPQHGGVAVEILGGPKPEGKRDGGGIVDEPMQGGRRPAVLEPGEGAGVELHELADRKSTRLNSSHLVISYAVFCLKKKKKQGGSQHGA